MADGEAVDWDGAERALPDRHRGIARALRTIAESGSGSSRDTAVSDPARASNGAVAWLWPILALGAIHVGLGVAGLRLVVRTDVLWPGAWGHAVMLAFGGAALWLVWGGVRDPRALYLGGVFMTAASAFAARPASALAAAREWHWSGHPWWDAMPLEAFLPLCLWCFVRSFPRVLHLERTERLIRGAIATAAGAGLSLFVLNAVAAFGGLGPAASLRRWDASSPPGIGAIAYWGAVAGLAAPALPLSLLRARSAAPPERRRVRRFALGLALGLGPLVAEILAEAVVPPLRRVLDTPSGMTVGSLLVFLPLLSVPVVTAHAVMADRLLDVRPLLDRAARYLLARTTLSLLTLVPLGGLAVYLYSRRAEPLAALLKGPGGLLLLGTAGAGVLLLASRERLTRRLDAVFDRSQADWSSLRLRAGQLVRQGRTAREVAGNLVVELARELQIDAAALLVGARDRRWFVPLAGQARPLRGDSALHALAAAEPSPLSTDPGDPGSVFPLLPLEDQRWVLDTQTALLAPLAASDGENAGLLALGAKRNDALFTADDRRELSGLCDAVALALENRGLSEALQAGPPPQLEQDLPATECPRCGRVHATESELCPCGTPVVVAALPRVLLGRLELRERLGEGGMGLVYRAFDRELERSVAVKTLPRVSEEATQRLRQEARAMAAVSHPGVAVIYGVETWQGLPFLVVEHLAGGTLARRLGSRWAVDAALSLCSDLADALDAIHRRGLLHRDVKPSNIGFDAESHPKLLDFGLARLVPVPGAKGTAARPWAEETWLQRGEAAHTRSRGLAGTPLYLSPEAMAGETPGPLQDLWGLSIVLFELLAGVHPFRGGGVEETLERIRRGRRDDVRRWAPGCPEPVAGLLDRALHADPGRRPATASTLQSEIRALLAAPR